jgi:electron transfer flavoprotein beta subunit
MKIAVCVKHVPTGQLRFDGSQERLDRSGPGEINPGDTNAVEAALGVRDTHGGEVVVVSMGTPQTVESLRTALAMGVDRAVLVTDPRAAGSDLVATSKILAKALERENADLIVFGQQASDGLGGAVWSAVAERLRLPFVSQVIRLSITGGGVSATRQTEIGDDEVEAPLPVVVSVSDAMNDPRYPSLKGKMAAKKKPLDTLSLADLAIAADDAGPAGSRTVVVAVGPSPGRADATRVEDEGIAAKAIVDFMIERGFA